MRRVFGAGAVLAVIAALWRRVGKSQRAQRRDAEAGLLTKVAFPMMVLLLSVNLSAEPMAW